MRADDDPVDFLRDAHRAASNAVDDAPGPGVRAAVLAAAVRGVGAQPRRVAATSADARPSGVRRWPLSAAALLVVSIVTGLVATRVMRSDPERATTIASVTPTASKASSAPAAMDAVSPPAAPPTPSHEAKASAASGNAAAVTTRPQQRQDSTRNGSRPSDLQVGADRAAPSVARVAVPAPTHAREAPAAPPAQALTETQEFADAQSRAEAMQTPDADASSSGATSAMRARVGRTAEPASAEAWVERIVRLRADGNDLEADRELEGLRRRYPGFVVPTSALRANGTR